MRFPAVLSAGLAALLPLLAACDGGGATQPAPPAECDVFLGGVEPADTAVVLGRDYSLRLQLGPGSCTRKPTYEVSSSAVTVDADGRVTAHAYGRVRIVAKAAGPGDTVWVSVVPSGMLAATDAPRDRRGGPSVLRTDLSGFRRLAPWTGIVWGWFLAAHWHPSGSHLIYMDDREIVRIDTLGGQPQRIFLRPAGMYDAIYPIYTRDGAWIYFGGYENGRNPLWRMRSDGTGAARVVSSDLWSDHPTDVSPDGRWLAYRTDSAYPLATRFWNLETGGIAAGGISQSGIRYSPSGDSIAYHRDGVLHVAAVDGSGERVLVPDGTHYYPWVSWSPDGKWIAARTSASPDNERVQLIQVQTGLAIPLPGTQDLYQPEWNPAVQ